MYYRSVELYHFYLAPCSFTRSFIPPAPDPPRHARMHTSFSHSSALVSLLVVLSYQSATVHKEPRWSAVTKVHPNTENQAIFPGSTPQPCTLLSLHPSPSARGTSVFTSPSSPTTKAGHFPTNSSHTPHLPITSPPPTATMTDAKPALTLSVEKVPPPPPLLPLLALRAPQLLLSPLLQL